MTVNSPPRELPKLLHLDKVKSTNDMLTIEMVINTEYYQNCCDYRTQCHVLYEMLHIFGFTKNKIANLLCVDHKSYEKQLRLPIIPRPNGRPQALTSDEKLILFDKIQKYHDKNIKPTIYNMQQFILSTIRKSISPDTIHRYIDESTKYKVIKGEPMDENRYVVSSNDMDLYYTNLGNVVNGCPASLVFNMDEAGQDEFIDTHSMMVIVPIFCTDKVTKIPVRRQSKRATLVNCICADGTMTKPLLILPRKTLDSVLLKRITCNNVMLKYQEKGYANTDIIIKWLEEIFLPTVEYKWKEENKRSGYNGNAVLILDGFSSHAKALSHFQLNNYHLTLVYLVPHSSHLSQPLDLVIFCLQKLFTIRRRISNPLSAPADKIRSILKGLQESCSTENIVSAFEAAGIFHYFPKQNINFNDFMPTCIVIKENSRFYQGEKKEVPVSNFRIGM